MKRVQVNGSFGTVKYTGELVGKPGIWVGVEWDFGGKHSGQYGGKSYFVTSREGGGSFVPVERVLTPRGFEEALDEKYSGGSSDIKIAFGGDGILVETVGWEKVQAKQARYQSLAEIGLAGMQIGYATCIAELVPAVIDLDLSRNLFDSWAQIADIVKQLPGLQLLRLSYNRLNFCPLDNSCFNNVSILTMMNSGLTGLDVVHILSLFNNLTEIHVGNNVIDSLELTSFPKSLQVVNLENNLICDCMSISKLGSLPSLRYLNLIGNQIKHIGNAFVTIGFESLEAINLGSNPFAEWNGLHFLNNFPKLTDIRIKDIELGKDMRNLDRRASFIGRLVKITLLNGSTITARERLDAELWYLSSVCAPALEAMEPAEFLATHPNYEYLCRIYGKPSVNKNPLKTNSALKNRLVSLEIIHGSRTLVQKFPPSISMNLLRTIVLKLLQLSKSCNFDLILDQETVNPDDGFHLEYYSAKVLEVVLIQ